MKDSQATDIHHPQSGTDYTLFTRTNFVNCEEADVNKFIVSDSHLSVEDISIDKLE